MGLFDGHRCAKLELLPDNIKLYMEDGTEIDDDISLKVLPAGTVIYLLRDTDQKPWLPCENFPPAPSDDVSAVESCSSLDTSVSDDNGLNLKKLPWPKVLSIQIHKFSSHLSEGLEIGTLSWDQRHELMSHLGSFIAQYTDYPSLQQRNDVAKIIVDKFPQIRSTIGEGYLGLSTRIHDKMRELRRKKRCHEKGSGKMPMQPKHRKLHNLQTRGVINWSPPPPEGEDDFSMISHKEWLKKEWKKIKSTQDILTVNHKMERCFSYRRKEINSNIPLLTVKEEYPFMFTVEGMVKEFEMLMQIDIDKTFLLETNIIAKYVFNIVNGKKKPTKELNYILEEYNCNQSKHVNDSLVMCILSLPYLFSESCNSLYKIYSDTTSADEIMEGVTTPRVAVIGSPFKSSIVFVVAEGGKLIECTEFVQGIIACLALYYCCNVEYPVETKCSYIFMQMQILKLPHYGKVPRKVVTFIDKLKQFNDNKD